MKNIRHLLDVVDGVRDDVALGLMSDPGLSKTSQVKQWADDNNRRYCELIISQRMPSEISGMPMPVTETQKMEVFDFQTLLELNEGDVLAFDEFTNGNIQTLNACLTLIQERVMLSGHKLPSLVVVAMGNPQGRCELLPQTKQRFLWTTVKWDAGTWIQYMSKTWEFKPNNDMVDFISAQYKDGFSRPGEYNFWTPRTVENLVRIARKVDRDDSFWTVTEIPEKLVTAIYTSMNHIDPVEKTKDLLTAWGMERYNEAQTDADATKYGQFVDDVSMCRTLSDLRNYIKDLETVNNFMGNKELLTGLFDFLRSTGITELSRPTEADFGVINNVKPGARRF